MSAGWYLESRDWSWRLFSLKQVEDRVAISSGVPFLAYTQRLAQWSRLITVTGMILAQTTNLTKAALRKGKLQSRVAGATHF